MKQQVSVPFMLLGILFNVCLIAANPEKTCDAVNSGRVF